MPAITYFAFLGVNFISLAITKDFTINVVCFVNLCRYIARVLFIFSPFWIRIQNISLFVLYGFVLLFNNAFCKCCSCLLINMNFPHEFHVHAFICLWKPWNNAFVHVHDWEIKKSQDNIIVQYPKLCIAICIFAEL